MVLITKTFLNKSKQATQKANDCYVASRLLFEQSMFTPIKHARSTQIEWKQPFARFISWNANGKFPALARIRRIAGKVYDDGQVA